jgi:hypothetical protein
MRHQVELVAQACERDHKPDFAGMTRTGKSENS